MYILINIDSYVNPSLPPCSYPRWPWECFLIHVRGVLFCVLFELLKAKCCTGFVIVKGGGKLSA